MRYSAIELFYDRAIATVDGLVLDDGDVRAVLEICRRLDAMPLALELAAARVDAFGAKGLAAQLDDRFAVLTKGRRTALPRHQTLRAAMDWSYDLLPEIEQVVFRRLAVFRGGFTLEGAAAVAVDERIKAANVIEGVANLAGKSLVTTDISGELTYHRLLDTTQAYAFEKLGESGERERLARRHAEYYWDLFERAEIASETRPRAEWLAHYGGQIDNLRAALDWAFSPSGDPSVGVALTAAAVALWMHLSLMEECRSRVEQALAALAAGANGDARREMKLHAALGASLIHTRGAAGPEIGAAWTKALEIAESLDDAEYRLRSLWGLGYFHSMSGRNDLALVMAQKFCSLAAASADPNDLLVGERMIGVSRYFLGDLPNARRHIERALAHHEASDHSAHVIRFPIDQRMAAVVFLARILWLQGFPEQAMRAAESSVEAAQAANHAISLCYALAYAACPIAFWVGDLAAAEHYVGMLLDHSTRHALARWRALGRGHRGLLTIKRGDVIAGLGLLRAGLDESGKERAAARSLIFLTEMAEALGRAGEIADGLAVAEEAIARSEQIQARWTIAELLRVKGELLLLRGTQEAEAVAEDHFRQALVWARGQGALSWELRAATSFARLLREKGRSTDAMALLQPVYGRFTEGFTTSDLQEAKSLLEKLA
jgi:predicted ATPase